MIDFWDNQFNRPAEEAAAPLPAKADILMAKKSMIESKLFARLLDELGYTYESVSSIEALEEALRTGRYRLLLFDKELRGLSLEKLHGEIQSSSPETSLVMLVDPSKPEEPSDANYVHEIVRNVINKDLLRLVFEKFI